MIGFTLTDVTCRVRHSDVLEWLWFLNSHQRLVSDWMWGDKDTFRLAFALAGKDADFWQVLVLTCWNTTVESFLCAI